MLLVKEVVVLVGVHVIDGVRRYQYDMDFSFAGELYQTLDVFLI